MYQLNTPLLSTFNIEPFLYLNAAIAPNNNSQCEESGVVANISRMVRDYGRAAVGLGASMQLSSLAFEFYYSLGVYHQKHELANEFQFNIGFD